MILRCCWAGSSWPCCSASALHSGKTSSNLCLASRIFCVREAKRKTWSKRQEQVKPNRAKESEQLKRRVKANGCVQNLEDGPGSDLPSTKYELPSAVLVL